MKLTLLLPATTSEKWTLATQVGVTHAVTKAAPQLTKMPAPDDLASLRAIRDGFAEAGITLVGLEGDQFDMSRIKRGEPGRDEDIERYQRMLRNMGELGIELLCYNFMVRPRGWQYDWCRTATDVPLRGGALTTRFDAAALHEGELELTHDELWANYAYFIRAVMPVAEEAGVKMGLHPDDPPRPRLAEVARIFGRAEAWDRAHQLAPSPSNGVTFCQANFKLMGADLGACVRKLAAEKRLFFVHIRDVEGNAERFTEVWHDEGPTDMAAMLKLYHEVGFDGPMRDDHVPTMCGEKCDIPGYAMLGHLFAVGYLKGLMRAQGIPYR